MRPKYRNGHKVERSRPIVGAYKPFSRKRPSIHETGKLVPNTTQIKLDKG